MPGPVNLVSWIRMPNDVTAPIGVDTEIFRWPAILEPGSRLIRLSVGGAVMASSIEWLPSIELRTLGLVRYTSSFFRLAPPLGPYAPGAGLIEFVANITGGQREFIIWARPSVEDLTLLGVGSDDGWQATLEDLGAST